MCRRTVCQDCGKFTWTGCGLHITEVLSGLPLEQICSCDDDRDSEHSWATLTNQHVGATTTSTTSFTSLSTLDNRTKATIVPPTPQYPLASSAASTSTAFTSTSTSLPGVLQGQPQTRTQILQPSPGTDPTKGHCPDPSPIEYKLSKISSATAEAAANRMVQQATALEELRRIKQKKEQELKDANENALQRLLQGLSNVTEDVE